MASLARLFRCWDFPLEQEIVWTCDFGEEATLAPGEETKCVGQYVLIQDNLDDGQVRRALFRFKIVHARIRGVLREHVKMLYAHLHVY